MDHMILALELANPTLCTSFLTTSIQVTALKCFQKIKINCLEIMCDSQYIYIYIYMLCVENTHIARICRLQNCIVYAFI